MCDAFRDQLPGLVAGHLDPTARARTEAHVAGCADCRAEAAEWRRIADAVRAMAVARAGEVPPYDGAGGPTAARPTPLTDLPPVATRRRAHARPVLIAGVAMVGAVITAGWHLTGRNDPANEADPAVVDIAGAGHRSQIQAPASIAERTEGRGSSGGAPGPAAPWATVVARTGDRLASGPAGGIARTGHPPLGSAGATAPVPLATEGKAGDGAPAAGMAPAAGGGRAPVGLRPEAPGNGSHGDRPREPNPPPIGIEPSGTPPADPTPTIAPTAQVVPPDLPSATPLAVTGTITGTVKGADGLPRAEILIIAEPEDPAAGAPATTLSDVTGVFVLTLPPGGWIVHAETAAFQLMWHPGRTNPIHAEPIAVAAGATAAVTFNLEPNPAGMVVGRVTDAAGAPRARVAVIAAIPDDGDGGRPILTAAVFTDADGLYALPVPPGAYLIAAATTRRFGDLVWWGGNGTLDQADRIGVRGPDPVRADLVLGQ